jgi:hypothetical protein
LRLAVGNPFRAPGLTIVEVDSAGLVAFATHRHDKSVQDWAEVGAERAGAIVTAAADALRCLCGRGPLRRLPDEALYQFEVASGCEALQNAVLTETVVERNEKLAGVLKALNEVLASVAPGRHFIGDGPEVGRQHFDQLVHASRLGRST